MAGATVKSPCAGKPARMTKASRLALIRITGATKLRGGFVRKGPGLVAIM